MFDFHEFFLGFWTSLSIFVAAAYILICCSEHVFKKLEQFADTLNTKIDEVYGAVVQKLPDTELTLDV